MFLKKLACVLIWCSSWNRGSRVFNELYWGFDPPIPFEFI